MNISFAKFWKTKVQNTERKHKKKQIQNASAAYSLDVPIVADWHCCQMRTSKKSSENKSTKVQKYKIQIRIQIQIQNAWTYILEIPVVAYDSLVDKQDLAKSFWKQNTKLKYKYRYKQKYNIDKKYKYKMHHHIFSSGIFAWLANRNRPKKLLKTKVQNRFSKYQLPYPPSLIHFWSQSLSNTVDDFCCWEFPYWSDLIPRKVWPILLIMTD